MKHKTKGRLLWPGMLALTLALVLTLTGMGRHDAAGKLPPTLQELYDRNSEARSSLLQYDSYRDAGPAIDLSGEVTPGQAPLLLQWDVRWAFRSYNDDYMACTGCGPTCLSMAVIGLTGDTACDPWSVAQYAESGGYSVPGSGTSWSFIPEGAAHYGLTARELALSEEQVTDALENGQLVILVVGPGDFTTTGHFLLLTGTEAGGFRLNDPNSPKNSGRVWPWERLEGQILNLWAVG